MTTEEITTGCPDMTSDEELRELHEERNLKIQETKDLAVKQVLEELKRDLPEFEIQPEELTKALDINYNVKKNRQCWIIY